MDTDILPGETFDNADETQYLSELDFAVSILGEQLDQTGTDSGGKGEKKHLRCIVCGAKASGHNFDQITCESCKAFFRRNALRNMNSCRCRFGGSCQITVQNRRHCTYCRIKKCFSVGMRKEWIQSEAEKCLKRMHSEKKRKSKANNRSLQFVTKPSADALSTTVVSPTDRMRIHCVCQCYDQYTADPSILKYFTSPEILPLRLHEFFNRKKPILINFISYFKHLPEFDQVNVDDQVLLIKQNIRLLLPINCALLETPLHSQFRSTNIQTIGCLNNITLHTIYQHLSNSFVHFVTSDPAMIKLLLIILFFTPNSQSINFDSVKYQQITTIKSIQSSYIELLWVYLSEKWGVVQAIHLYTKVIATYLRLQIIIDRIDAIIRASDDVQYLDSLMKTILQLT